MTFLLLSLSISILSSLPPQLSANTDSTKSIRDRQNLALLPIIFSSPDTRLAFGVLPQILFRTSSSSNLSSIRMDAYYTLNKQYHILVRPKLWIQNDSKNIFGTFSFKKWPTSFYGIGNDTPKDGQEKFTEDLYEFSIGGITEIGNDYYTGIDYSLRYGEIEPHEEFGQLASGSVTGSGNAFVSAIGFIARKDTRDNHFYPKKGGYHTVELLRSEKILGSEFTFTRLSIDLRQYVSIFKSQVLAFQGTMSLSKGEVPFRMLSSVGSRIRGYPSMRYIDKNMIGFQMEYRFVPAVWRMGFTLFAGAGDVFNHWSDLQFDRLKYSIGIGLRYQFFRSEKINIRFDYGMGKKSSGDYLDLNEAF